MLPRRLLGVRRADRTPAPGLLLVLGRLEFAMCVRPQPFEGAEAAHFPLGTKNCIFVDTRLSETSVMSERSWEAPSVGAKNSQPTVTHTRLGT